MHKDSFQVTLISNGHMGIIPISQEMGDGWRAEGHKRVMVEVNGEYSYHASLQTRKNQGYYVYAGKKVQKAAGIEIGEELQVRLLEDTTEFQLAMPEELKAVLDTDWEAEEIFKKLTDGNKRSIVHWIISVKSSDLRIEKALRVAENLKMGLTNPRKY